ncbi:hypothetical protein SAMN05444370_11630 [Rubrimonas cliftonensis]|uniref:Stringent starvation protein B n=1 Tax=Rubrimonas cliftonensis TaxID=89524 RepID=A0A1H4EWY8_9RHOB|nr:ClpXP protease specificity-enhancing factor SspB [Rubrimonas cliftonensis]SEA89098.1 hypothetical protein SAMN05444370_11630 [Rubrimonas cliftonensis]
MAVSGFNYGRLMQRAMRGLMAEVLGVVARRGLPGGHHFFITFSTTHPGVDVPEWLKAQYPEELSIVLQHEFSDLAVASDRFSVTLSFADRLATLVVPFDAVTTFADPSENFGLRFDESESQEGGDGDGGPERPGPRPTPGGPGADRPTSGEAEVVRLDTFRKR